MTRALPYRGYAAFQALFGALLAGVGLVALPPPNSIVAAALGGMFMLIALFLVAIAARRRKLVRRLTADHFVTWTYSAEEWRPHVASERARIRKLALWGHAFFALFAVAIALAVEGGAATYAVALVLSQVYVFFTARNVAQSLENLGETGECFIGNDGLFVTGQCHAWGGGFIKATLHEEPLRLEFAFSSGPESTAKVTIPVPAGEDGKVRHVLKRWGKD